MTAPIPADRQFYAADLVSEPSRATRLRGQNFYVTLIHSSVETRRIEASSGAECLLLLPDGRADLDVIGREYPLPRRSISVVPAGTFSLVVPRDTSAVILSVGGYAIGGAESPGAPPDPLVAPLDVPMARNSPLTAPEIHEVDKVVPHPSSPRLKMFQSDCLSINWVEYDGERDNSKLSPHAHEDFQQGSLALAGDFRHHLRVPWGPDAGKWKEDEHLAASSPSLLVIPPRIIHTTEGVGDGRHLLIDIFAPPRADFIARGSVANSASYVPLTRT